MTCEGRRYVVAFLPAFGDTLGTDLAASGRTALATASGRVALATEMLEVDSVQEWRGRIWQWRHQAGHRGWVRREDLEHAGSVSR